MLTSLRRSTKHFWRKLVFFFKPGFLHVFLIAVEDFFDLLLTLVAEVLEIFLRISKDVIYIFRKFFRELFYIFRKFLKGCFNIFFSLVQWCAYKVLYFLEDVGAMDSKEIYGWIFFWVYLEIGFLFFFFPFEDWALNYMLKKGVDSKNMSFFMFSWKLFLEILKDIFF